MAYSRFVEKAVAFSISEVMVRALRASLLASVAATAAWALGLMKEIWPAHPQWVLFFLTIGATVMLYYILPKPEEKSKSEGTQLAPVVSHKQPDAGDAGGSGGET